MASMVSLPAEFPLLEESLNRNIEVIRTHLVKTDTDDIINALFLLNAPIFSDNNGIPSCDIFKLANNIPLEYSQIIEIIEYIYPGFGWHFIDINNIQDIYTYFSTSMKNSHAFLCHFYDSRQHIPSKYTPHLLSSYNYKNCILYKKEGIDTPILIQIYNDKEIKCDLNSPECLSELSTGVSFKILCTTLPFPS
jgi:hypothetical protein